MKNGDYVLGTHGSELERLGLQHRVWRKRMLDALETAGVREGQTIIDVGAGPGFATADLAKLTGPRGKVIALERSSFFLARLREEMPSNVEVWEADVNEEFGRTVADASWCRWVLAFATRPSEVVRNIAKALKSGGVAIFHEYAAYSTWRLMPPDDVQEEFRRFVEQSWRDNGGEPDAALWLPKWLSDAGLELVGTRMFSDILSPSDPAWEWPRSFMAVNAARLHDLGYVSSSRAAAMAKLLDHLAPEVRMLTPLVAEVIARKR
jgi:SAM-dependent methyltransferase